MTTKYNEKLQRDLMRAIAVRALMNASGDNCFCPVKKPTKFIVTLKPVVKVPNADPFINIQPKFSACTCNTKSSEKTTLTPEQIHVRNNTEALKGKTLLNAFRVLTNSKFISIDPKYNYGNSGILSPSCDKLRLAGGGGGRSVTNENVLLQVREPAKNDGTCECTKHPDRPAPGRVTLSKSTKPAEVKRSKEKICNQDRIYHILQRNCYDETLREMQPRCHIVCTTGENPGKVKQPKKEKKQTQKTTKERAELRKELEQEVDGPTCVEKAIGTSDFSCTTPPQQQEPPPPKAMEKLAWDPLKYFGISCSQENKQEDENCEQKAPCPLSMFPFPRIRKPVSSEAEDCQFDIESHQAAKSTEKAPRKLDKVARPCDSKAQQTAPACPALVEKPPVHEREIHYEPHTRPPDVSSEIIAQQCHRIKKLEQQVDQMRHELSRMKNEIIPADDMLRCTALTSKLRELTALLADLKNRHAEAIATVIMTQKQQGKEKREQTFDTPPSHAPEPSMQPRPETRAEQVQTCFADSYKDELSQTNATFGWRPFVDEATQSSPPSTVRVTPRNTSSVPPSSHTSSVASATNLPCRHNTGEIPLQKSPSFCPHCQCSDHPRCTYVETNLCGEIHALLQQHPPCDVLLSVLLQPNNLYHVNVSVTSTGKPLGCIYATEQAINEAVEADVFNRFLTFFIVDARISMQQKDKILAHTFEFFKN
ncbi:uncharacterized protein [Eurosta solidaginis]|uniref:uncharacterized protein n=1 Tax=Eurosta solidaginis TaxID=178769 RepID=UPI00353101C6